MVDYHLVECPALVDHYTTGRLREFTLSENYVDAMKVHARLRLALAGRRLALWFEDKL